MAAIAISIGSLDALATVDEEIARRDNAQVGVAGDLARTFPGRFGEITFGQSLQPPGDAAEEVLAMAAWRVFAKYLAMFFAQGAKACAAQLLDLNQYGGFQRLRFPLCGR